MNLLEKMVIFVCEIDTYQSVIAGLENTYAEDSE